MAKVGIATDTIACLSSETIEEYGIGIVPVLMTLNGKEYRDRVDISPDEFWNIYPEIQDYSTAAPPAIEFIKAFEELSQTTDSIACTFVSKALSATFEAALQARNMFQKDHPKVKIEVVDSRNAAGAQGFVVLEMAKAAREGKTLEQVVEIANNMVPKVRYITALEGLKRLIKIGRAPKTAYIGELFQVKPLIGMVNNTGVVENLGKARGTEKTMQKMLEMMDVYIDRDKPLNITIHYTTSIEEGQKLKEMVTEKYNVVESFFTPYSPVICLAIGPAISVAFYQ